MKDSQTNKEILFITLHLTDGGAERVASELTKTWIQKGIKVKIVQLLPEMFSNSYSMPQGVDYINLSLGNNKYQRLVNGVLQVIKIMRQYPHATVLCFSKKTIYVVAIASLFTKNRIVFSERNDPYSSPEERVRRIIRDWAFRRADACVFQTPDARDYFPKVVRDKGVIIPNPINSDLPKRYEGIRDKVIVAAGRLAPQKNFSMLIKAFALLHDDFPEYKLIIYGRGPLEDELKTLANKLGIAEFVCFPGFSDNIYQDMLKCAVYVSSSDYEGMSNSMLEAMAMGIPSVVTDCPIGGARMVIKDGVNGVLVPVGDEISMSKALNMVLSNDAFAGSIGRAAYELREELPIEKIADKWLEVI